MNATLPSPSAAMAGESLKPEWLRLPAPGSRCRFTGLSRSTLNELTIAYDVGTPVIVLRGSGGWSDRIESSLVDGRFLDERRTSELEFAADPEDAVSQALAAVDRPRRTGGLVAHLGHAGH